MDTVKYFGQKTRDVLSNWRSWPVQIMHAVKRDPFFCALILVSYLCFCFTITTVSGAFIQYNAPMPNRFGRFMTSAKIGLFNAATNETWYTFSHSRCMSAINITAEQIAVCNARISIGTLTLISLFATLIASLLLTIMITRTLYEERIAQAKYIVMGLFTFSGLSNLLAMSLGAGIIYKIVSSDPNVVSSAYGVGFIFSVVNWILYVFMIPATYMLVSSDGVIQTLPRLKAKPAVSQPTRFY